MAVLVWDSRRGRKVVELSRSVLLVGRGDHCDVQILERTVSRRHALVQIEGDRIYLTDLGAKQGTRINGAVLTPDLRSTVEPGDFVSFGDAMVMVLKTAPPQGARLPVAPAPPKKSARPPSSPVAAAPAAASAPAATAPRTTAPKRTRPPSRDASGPTPSRSRPGIRIALAGGGLVAVVAAVLVVSGNDNTSGDPAIQPETAKEFLPKREVPPPRKESAQLVVPKPPLKDSEDHDEPVDTKSKGPPRAPMGALPPRKGKAASLPIILELAGGKFAAVRLREWDELRLEVLGRDGRVYVLPGSRVVAIHDRKFLERQADAAKNLKDVDGTLKLAAWCSARSLEQRARELVRHVLQERPEDPVAAALLESLGAEE